MRCKFDMVHKRLSVLKNALRASLSVALLSSAMVVGISTSAMAADPVATKKPVDIAKGKAAAAAVCAGCHMPDGNSMIAQNPILAGQHAAYIEKQLVNFRLSCRALPPCSLKKTCAILALFMHRRHRNPPRPSAKIWLQQASAFIGQVFRKRVCRLVQDVMALVLRGFLPSIRDLQASIRNTPRPR
jgi:cytochrome c553